MLKVLSLFDGISCGQIALKNLNADYIYYSSEIDKYPMMVTNRNFPNTIQLGDVTKIDYSTIDYDMLIGGSPCQSFSMMGTRKGMVTPQNIEVTSYDQYLTLKNEGMSFENSPSTLFWEFVRALRNGKPKYFLLENTKMKQKWMDVISNELGVKPILINSSTITAQHRERLYWTNIPNVIQPQDLGIKIWDVLGDCKSCGTRGVKNKLTNKYEPTFTIRDNGKANCIVTRPHGTNKLIYPDGSIKMMTPEQCELLQGIPINYTKGIPNTARYNAIGNAWTIPVIEHIFKCIPELNRVKQIA
jgi:site-specific DNA-cytosine methylase